MLEYIDGMQIHYEVIGEGKPVIMLHGCACDYRLMLGCMEPVFNMCEGYQRIYIDLPGMGETKAPLSEGSSDKIMELLITFIKRVTKGSFLIAGESYGGYLARGILTRLSQDIDGFLMICPVIVPGHNLRNVPGKEVLQYDEEFLRGLSADERESYCGYAVVANQDIFQRYQEEILPGLKMADSSFIEKLQNDYAFSFDVDRKSRELRFEKPVLLLAGRQDNCVGYQDLWSIIEDYPRGTFAVLDMAGHNLQIEQSEIFNSLVKEWIQRTEKNSIQ
ncbi:acetoin dehydrogenase E2 subunit dihydrolipoyllysine-residue acetyltransferase [Robinsoniella peoriensis]|uniref:Acetoin dehydrogenase E2 subunit dihydrolipoyllysine-residue acetyltransferase n=2 Tax=Robinsoniella peoriensis TaxID=180332 RepID=A0A4U8QNX3_9FIRM|nr:acetoin dehydrogenase E2 subunit dihydrolipoyllysine-residue acetyltransferase [Robinsoniella peoriensis]